MAEEDKKLSGIRIDITSGVAESLINGAKSFLGKILSPGAEEAGNILLDQVRSYRFKKQVKILNKAKRICEENDIPTKAISLKLLSPLLEFASLEEDEFLEDRWATLISNLVDSTKNIENHIFPYILSQISVSEYKFLERLTERFRLSLGDSRRELKDKVLVFLKDKKDAVEIVPGEIPNNRLSIYKNILEIDDVVWLENYELENLKRLGLLEESRTYQLTDKENNSSSFLDGLFGT